MAQSGSAGNPLLVPSTPHVPFSVIDSLQQSGEAGCLLNRPRTAELGPEKRQLLIGH